MHLHTEMRTHIEPTHKYAYMHIYRHTCRFIFICSHTSLHTCVSLSKPIARAQRARRLPTASCCNRFCEVFKWLEGCSRVTRNVLRARGRKGTYSKEGPFIPHWSGGVVSSGLAQVLQFFSENACGHLAGEPRALSLVGLPGVVDGGRFLN